MTQSRAGAAALAVRGCRLTDGIEWNILLCYCNYGME